MAVNKACSSHHIERGIVCANHTNEAIAPDRIFVPRGTLVLDPGKSPTVLHINIAYADLLGKVGLAFLVVAYNALLGSPLALKDGWIIGPRQRR